VTNAQHVVEHAVEDATAGLHDVERAYAGNSDVELRPYVNLVATYGGLVAAFAFLYRRSGRPLPDRVPLLDLGLLGAATFKTSRLLTRDRVTSFLRAPFTRYKGPAKAQEVNEEPRGHGTQHAVGELVACPFCSAQWLGTALMCSYVVAPRATRLASAALAAVTMADGLQYAHTALQERFG